MAKVKLTLDKRADHKSSDGKCPLVLRISHQSKSRDIQMDIHVFEDQFDDKTGKITGIQNSVRKTKKAQKTLSDVDLWLDDNKGEIRLWNISRLKDTIERKFFGKQSDLSLLQHSAKVLGRFHAEGKFSTASSYEDALKIFVKFQMKHAKQDDSVRITTLYNKNKQDLLILKEEYEAYDFPMKAIDVNFIEDFKAYLHTRTKSKNSVSIYLRSLQAILNKAERAHDELKGHKPLEGIQKTSSANQPVVLTHDEIESIRKLKYETDSWRFHARNYFLFMFNNMGMNFYDVALAKVEQFDGERFQYTRKKTAKEGDFFSIKQSPENVDILTHYIQDKEPEQYIFPILDDGMAQAEIFNRKRFKLKWFNMNLKKIAKDCEIAKNLTSYVARDTWTNLGLEMGIDIRKISSGLGHSSVQLTEKHYAQTIQENLLDEINVKITNGFNPT